MTNYEWIKAMTVEEMENFMYGVYLEGRKWTVEESSPYYEDWLNEERIEDE